MSPSHLPRRRLLPPWALALFGAAMLMIIVLIFPKASVFQQLGGGGGGDADHGDSVRVLLLRSLLAKGEKGFPLRREYIRQLGLTGDYAGAFAEFDRLQTDRGSPRDSLWMLEIEVASWAFSSASGKDANAAARLRTAGEELLQGGTPSHLAWAGEKAGAGGAYDLAAKLYLRAAGADSLHPAWYRRSAEMSRAAGDCQGASAALFAALDGRKDGAVLKDAAERKSAFLDGLRDLQACGRLDEALAAADSRMREWSGDTEVLLFLVRLAQAADRPGQAQRYAQLLVKPIASGPRP
ncbi:MAG: hypothetical protein JF616_19630 [Fibrobacteres bacterium]|jgi:hypothetical protein|nr:hypothetical protein [Fibrobacterota bacterium]